MFRRSCLIVFVAAALACGGSDGDDAQPVDPGPKMPTVTAPTMTVGSTVIAVGESKSIDAQVGDTLTIHASEPVPGLTVSHGAGEACVLQWPAGIQTGVDTYTIKVGTGTTECSLTVSFDEGDATLTIRVP